MTLWGSAEIAMLPFLLDYFLSFMGKINISIILLVCLTYAFTCCDLGAVIGSVCMWV